MKDFVLTHEPSYSKLFVSTNTDQEVELTLFGTDIVNEKGSTGIDFKMTIEQMESLAAHLHARIEEEKLKLKSK